MINDFKAMTTVEKIAVAISLFGTIILLAASVGNSELGQATGIILIISGVVSMLFAPKEVKEAPPKTFFPE